MITPMIAAYFLAAQGEQEHAAGPWVDRYEKLLAWTLDSSKQQRVRARYDAVPSKLAYLGVPLELAGAYILFSVYSYFQPVPAGQEGPNPAIHFLLLTPFRANVTFLATRLFALLLGAPAYDPGTRRECHRYGIG